MAATFNPRLECLPAPQQRLWPELTAVPADFVLFGGTALALQLGHRTSVDFDFFARHHIDPVALAGRVPFLATSTILQSEPDTLTCLVDRGGPIKVSFYGLPRLVLIEAPLVCAGTGLKIASLIDIAVSKMQVVQKRAQAKDYLDIDALISSGIGLDLALSAAKRAHGGRFAPTPTLKALAYFGDGDLPSLPEDLKQRMIAAVGRVDPLHLPEIPGPPQTATPPAGNTEP